MAFIDLIYRISAGVGHRLTARNTLGHGIHSPYLYYIVHYLLYDRNAYYVWRPIEKERLRLLRATKRVEVDDYGTGRSGPRLLKDIARCSLMPEHDAQMLFRLVAYLKPALSVELGTSLGITSAYLAAASPRGRLYTFEGSASLLSEASSVWDKIGLGNIRPMEGNIDLTLEPFLRDVKQVDFALIDANHTCEATLRYFDFLAARCGQKSVVVLDDIRYSLEMGRAWRAVKRDQRVTATLDTGDMGIVFFNPQLPHAHYKLRV